MTGVGGTTKPLPLFCRFCLIFSRTSVLFFFKNHAFTRFLRPLFPFLFEMFLICIKCHPKRGFFPPFNPWHNPQKNAHNRHGQGGQGSSSEPADPWRVVSLPTTPLRNRGTNASAPSWGERVPLWSKCVGEWRTADTGRVANKPTLVRPARGGYSSLRYSLRFFSASRFIRIH